MRKKSGAGRDSRRETQGQGGGQANGEAGVVDLEAGAFEKIKAISVSSPNLLRADD